MRNPTRDDDWQGVLWTLSLHDAQFISNLLAEHSAESQQAERLRTAIDSAVAARESVGWMTWERVIALVENREIGRDHRVEPFGRLFEFRVPLGDLDRVIFLGLPLRVPSIPYDKLLVDDWQMDIADGVATFRRTPLARVP